MNDQHLLFLRTGLTPRAIQLLSTHIEGGNTPTIRTCQRWFNGEKTPRNGIVGIAAYLDLVMTNYAVEVCREYTEVLNIITFDDDDELWNEHPSMMPLSASVHSALVNRIITIAQLNNIDVGTITNSREPSMQDWNSIANIFITTNHIPDIGNMVTHC